MVCGTARCAWAAAACLPLAAAFHLCSRWYADRMVAAGEGFAMAFYFSPMAFLVMDGILVVGASAGVIGAVAGPRLYHRAIAVVAGLACAGWFMQLP